MKLVVGSPGDIGSTEKILNEVGKDIAEIYLGVKVSTFGSARDEIYDLDLSELDQTVRMAYPYGVEISVALNAPCYSGKQFSKNFLEEYRTFLNAITEMGISHLVIADSFLIHFTLQQFPHLTVQVSSLSYVDSPEKARYYEKMGVERIILPIDLVRNLPLLKSIREAVSCQLEIMANLGCLYNCPYHTFHGQFHGHNSRKELKGLSGDPYKAVCNEILLQEPWRIVSSSFIRPEDISVYEDMGIEYLKLAGRELSLEWVIKVTNAYIARREDGNLLELLTTPHGLSSTMFMDTTKLNGFINTVGVCNKKCDDKECSIGRKGEKIQGCKEWAEKSLTML